MAGARSRGPVRFATGQLQSGAFVQVVPGPAAPVAYKRPCLEHEDLLADGEVGTGGEADPEAWLEVEALVKAEVETGEGRAGGEAGAQESVKGRAAKPRRQYRQVSKGFPDSHYLENLPPHNYSH